MARFSEKVSYPWYPKDAYSQTDRKQPQKSVILGEPFGARGFLAYLPKFRELKMHQSKPTNTGTPLKFNMEPNNWWFVVVSPLPRGYFQVPC